VAADTGAPLRRAEVRAFASDVRGNFVASTDPEGRYELRDLPAGNYRISASKAGFVTLQLGQVRPFEAGRPVTLADGQLLERVDLALPRGAVITGRVTDEYGEAIADVRVQALRQRIIGGRRQLAPVGSVSTTNDIGQFRLFGLSPGEYYVSAVARAFRGPEQPEEETGYAPTYYPGTPSLADARRLTVGIAQEFANVDFALMATRVVRITGMVIDSAGRPASGGNVTLQARDAGGGLMRMGFGGGSPIRDGSFRLTNVPSGDYMLVARTGGRDQQEFGSMPIGVGSSDLSGVTIATSRGATAQGQVVIGPGSTSTFNPASVRVTGLSVDPTMDFGPGGGSARVNDNLTFELRGLSGTRLIRTAGLPTGWSLQAVIVEGVDVTDTPIDFGAVRTVEGIHVVVTDRQTVVAGAVTDARGSAVSNYVAVLFAEDAARWGFQSRFVASARPDQEGRFRVTGLPPGRYLAVALDWIEDGGWTDPEVLERLRPLAASVTLGEGETKALNLNVAAP
jgi:hypothetical protein